MRRATQQITKPLETKKSRGFQLQQFIKGMQQRMNDEVIYKPESKNEWATQHVLTKEQVNQLILNKLNRAVVQAEARNKIKHLA